MGSFFTTSQHREEVIQEEKEKYFQLLLDGGVRKREAGVNVCNRFTNKCYEERNNLKQYRFGDALGREEFEQLNVQDMDNYKDGVRIALIGMSGAGKSSFINTCEMAIGPKPRGSSKIQANGLEGTFHLEEFLYDCCVKFRLIDTRGFHNFRQGELFAMKRIVYGDTELAETIQFETNGELAPKPIEYHIHACIIVLKCNDPRLLSGTYKDTFAEVRNFLKPIGITPVTVLTAMDKMPEGQTEQKIVNKASEVTGSPCDHVFFISNYRPGHMEVDCETNLKVFEIIRKTLEQAESYVKIVKQHEKHRKENNKEHFGITYIDNSSVRSDQTCEDFLREQMLINSWTSEDTDYVRNILQQNNIYLAKDLRNPKIWTCIQGSLSLGIKSNIKRALAM